MPNAAHVQLQCFEAAPFRITMPDQCSLAHAQSCASAPVHEMSLVPRARENKKKVHTKSESFFLSSSSAAFPLPLLFIAARRGCNMGEFANLAVCCGSVCSGVGCVARLPKRFRRAHSFVRGESTRSNDSRGANNCHFYRITEAVKLLGW